MSASKTELRQDIKEHEEIEMCKVEVLFRQRDS